MYPERPETQPNRPNSTFVIQSGLLTLRKQVRRPPDCLHNAEITTKQHTSY